MASILVIEDDSLTREFVKQSLIHSGFEVLLAPDGESGIKMAIENIPDLIICDIMMPKTDGYEVLQKIQANPITAPIPFIFLTVKKRREDRRKGMEMGADDYLTKPLRTNELIGAIRALFKKRELIMRGMTLASIAEMEHHIFLSYSREDVNIMQLLRDYFRTEELKVWEDQQLALGTPNWENIVSNAIRRSGCLVVVLSPDAEKSDWVGRELAMADKLNKRIFPILARGTDSDAIPLRLMTHQWVDARHNHSDAFQKLATAIRKYLSLDNPPVPPL